MDVVDDPRTGRPVEKLLRGKGGDTWGAVAMTFVNDQGGRFTALRTYYVPRRATRSADVQMQLVTHEGSLSLQVLEAAVADRFHANGSVYEDPFHECLPGHVNGSYGLQFDCINSLGQGGGGGRMSCVVCSDEQPCLFE